MGLECHKVSPTGGNIYPTLATLDALVRARNCIEGAVARSSTVGQQGMGGGDDVRDVTYTSTSEYEELLWCHEMRSLQDLLRPCVHQRAVFCAGLPAGPVSWPYLKDDSPRLSRRRSGNRGHRGL